MLKEAELQGMEHPAGHQPVQPAHRRHGVTCHLHAQDCAGTNDRAVEKYSAGTARSFTAAILDIRGAKLLPKKLKERLVRSRPCLRGSAIQLELNRS
jgi:hypothetical protein